MPTKAGGYWVNGTKVPSVTTILSRFKESGALIFWAWQQGKEGKDFRETKQAAADSGTLAHALIEADVKGGSPPDLSDFPELVQTNALHAFEAFKEWKNRSKCKIVETELALVSEKHMFGGTMDAMTVNDKLVLSDWKTSNAVYQDHLIQVAGGYSLLWEEHHPDQKLEGVEILRVSKPAEDGDPVSFHDHFWSRQVIDIAQRQFLLLREAYDLDKRLKGML